VTTRADRHARRDRDSDVGPAARGVVQSTGITGGSHLANHRRARPRTGHRPGRAHLGLCWTCLLGA
jgi:hypothetical protein